MLPFDGITCLMSQQVSGLFSLIVSWLSRWHVTKDLLTPLWQCHSVNIQFHPQWTMKCRKAFQSSTSQPNNGLKSHIMLRIAYLKLYLLWILKKYYQRRIYMYIHINRIIRPSYYNLASSISIFNLKDRKAVRSLNFNLNTKSRRVIYVFHLKHLLTVENVELWIYRQSLLWRSYVQETCRHYFIL